MSECKKGWYWVKMEYFPEWIPWEWIGESSLLEARWADCKEPVEVGPYIQSPDKSR